MTALKQYQRLESIGLWQPPADPSCTPEEGGARHAQRREVIVSFGKATLVLSDKGGRALAHWSLAAVERLNPGKRPALFAPDGEGSETLEIEDDDMIGAIEKVRAAVRRRQPSPGRLRRLTIAALLALLLGLALFWLPGALIRKTAAVVPPAKRAEIGADLLAAVGRVSGQPCTTPGGQQALEALARRLAGDGKAPPRLVVLPGGVASTAHLPGGIILINRSLVEDHDDPRVPAGHVLAEMLRAGSRDPLEAMLARLGVRATLHLLTTGDLDPAALARYGEEALPEEPAPLPPEVLLPAFGARAFSSTPYALALDITGETTLPLIEADPYRQGGRPVLGDDDWVSLQGICGE